MTFSFLGVDDRYHSPAFESQLNTRRDKQAMTRAGALVWDRALVPAGHTLPIGIRQRAAPSIRRLLSRSVRTPDPAGKHRLRSEGTAPAGGGAPASSNRHGVCNVVDVNDIQRASFRESFGFAAMSAAAGGVVGIVSSILVARLYGIEVIGQYALATAPMGIVWFFSTVRERPGLIRALNPLQPRSPEITGIFAAVLAFSIALTALVSMYRRRHHLPALQRSDRPTGVVRSRRGLSRRLSDRRQHRLEHRRRPRPLSERAGSCFGSACTRPSPSYSSPSGPA